MEKSRNLEVMVISTQTIKPSFPSPITENENTFKLSLLDQLAVSYYVPILLFYKGGGVGEAAKFPERSQHLMSSLSETLTHFYPFAGRLRDHLTVICNDEGVEYSEAQVLNSTLAAVLDKPDPNHLSLFLPDVDQESPLSTRPLLLVKVSLFGCGGMVLGFKCSHKIADAATCATFINAWANSAIGNTNEAVPDFSSSFALFPPTDSLPSPSQVPLHWPGARASRFVFGPSQLAALQATAADPNLPKPTRVQAVTSLLWLAALQAKNESSPKPSTLMWAVNLRSRLQPPLPEHCFGNLIAMPVAAYRGNDTVGSHLPIMAGQLKQGTIDICNRYVQTLKRDDSSSGILEMHKEVWTLYGEVLTGTMDLYGISSWCKFPFYEADFGWGKPVWATSSVTVPNAMTLTDTRDGHGIEAWVCLMETDMTALESNPELQKFASFNPTAFH